MEYIRGKLKQFPFWIGIACCNPTAAIAADMTVPVAMQNSEEALQAKAAWWKAQGDNPFLSVLFSPMAHTTMKPFVPPAADQVATSAWTYRMVAEATLPVAFMASDAQSPYRGRPDLVANAVAALDWLVTQCQPEGWWWHSPLANRPETNRAGDPNINRFVLGPLLESVRWLRELPEGKAAWPRWESKLAAAVNWQRTIYQGQGGETNEYRDAGHYVNQDAFYMQIMELSSKLWNKPEDHIAAGAMMKSIGNNLLPDGGFHYIGAENEAPVYHWLNMLLIGRYATLSGDPIAISVMKETARYWPLTLSEEGQPEHWSDVWWKQHWALSASDMAGTPGSLAISASVTRDPVNQWLFWQRLERNGFQENPWSGVYAAPYWPGNDPGTPMPVSFLIPDRNIRGVHGRNDHWYYGVTQGRGLRNTFVGGMVTRAEQSPLAAAFRGAQIEVVTDPKRPHGLWLSEVADNTAVALEPGIAAGLGARYTLQPSIINGYPTPKTPKTPWQVTQVWRAAGDGIIGVVTLEATQATAAQTILGRIALGPDPVRRVGEHDWASGPLRLRMLRQFGTVSAGVAPAFTETNAQAWPAVELRQDVAGGRVNTGDRFVYAVWVGPESVTPPDTLSLLSGDYGWVAHWTDGYRVGALFNPGDVAINLQLPWDGKAPAAWSGKDSMLFSCFPVRLEHDTARLTLASRSCALVE